MFGVTLDTNIYVSALEFGGVGARLLGMARAGMFRIDVSDAILDELLTVLRDDFRWDGYRLHFGREQDCQYDESRSAEAEARNYQGGPGR